MGFLNGNEDIQCFESQDGVDATFELGNGKRREAEEPATFDGAKEDSQNRIASRSSGLQTAGISGTSRHAATAPVLY